MKIFVFGLSVLMIIFSIGLKIILVMSYSSYKDLMQQRSQLLNSKNTFERILAIGLYWAVDHRVLLGVLGIAGFFMSLLIN